MAQDQLVQQSRAAAEMVRSSQDELTEVKAQLEHVKEIGGSGGGGDGGGGDGGGGGRGEGGAYIY